MSPDGTPADPSERPSPPIVAIIPARYQSTRLPGKPLADIGGHPMIEHVYRRAAAARSIDQVLVATDDERIARAVEAFGGRVRLTRPDHPTGTDRLAEVAAGLSCSLVVNVQGDLPFIDPAAIDEAVAPFFTETGLTMTTLRRRLETTRELDDPHVVKVVIARNGDALYFSRAPIPHRRNRSDEVPALYGHIGLYVYRRAFLLEFARLSPTPLERLEALEQLRALEHGFRIRTVETAHASLEVDTPEDLERVRRAAATGIRA